MAIVSRIRAIWRHLPPGGRLLFFDVQPVTVKAYGGQRYTSAHHLVLGRHQKTRGRFYLFLAYDLASGKVHWAFLPGKDSTKVCHFMRRVRRWYPRSEIWVALDRDSSHPHKSRLTRRTMRQLHLHYLSLPKGCPDDNPVETLFSPVQTMILNSSNDPDAGTTRRRISAYLRGHNRRDDRQIQISYLPDTHKH
jgi:transposase